MLLRIYNLGSPQKEIGHKGRQRSMMHAFMPKGMSRDEAISNSEMFKPIALAVIELHLPEAIRQLVENYIE